MKQRFITPKFICPKCDAILLFRGLTPNFVYEIFICPKCKTNFDHDRKYYYLPYGYKEEDYTRGWYELDGYNRKCLRYDKDMPRELTPEVVVFS